MKSIGENLYSLARSGKPAPSAPYRRVSAKALGLQESWFRDAIFAEPELVVGPCRSAGRVDVDEQWIPWRIEVNFGSGPIDVLLVSSHGRIGIVETKLSYNPQRRREVVAQVLDYALSLQECDFDDLPDLPDHPGAPLAEDLAECLRSGRFLLIIAGDALDPRALRLSQSMLARHLTSEWDLAMVDLNVYSRGDDEDGLLVVPELLGTVQSETRQVVRVLVEGESVKARVVVDKIVHDEERVSRTGSFSSVDQFLESLQERTPGQVELARRIVGRMQEMAGTSRGKLVFGMRAASASLYYAHDGGLRRFISLRTDGNLKLVLAYLRGAGLERTIDQLVGVAPPAFSIHRDDRAAGLRLRSDAEPKIFAFLDRVGSIFGVGA